MISRFRANDLAPMIRANTDENAQVIVYLAPHAVLSALRWTSSKFLLRIFFILYLRYVRRHSCVPWCGRATLMVMRGGLGHAGISIYWHVSLVSYLQEKPSQHWPWPPVTVSLLSVALYSLLNFSARVAMAAPTGQRSNARDDYLEKPLGVAWLQIFVTCRKCLCAICAEKSSMMRDTRTPIARTSFNRCRKPRVVYNRYN